MRIRREWAMPNKNTFSIKPIHHLITKYFITGHKWIDPFARNNTYDCVTNDLNPEFNTDYNLEALEFLNLFDNLSLDGVFFDPPYSPRQIKECYNGIGKKVQMQDTQSSFWSQRKDKIAELIKPFGLCISFGWNTNGLGLNRGFEILEILMVAHGGAHNDTIITVERKARTQYTLDLGGTE
tara:strand:+ start:3849 stop:4391 length:543 start_codon:yes stop_codon:yes gene_type:complete